MDTQRLPKKEEDDYQPSSTIESINAFSREDRHNYSMDDFDSIFDLNLDGSKCSQELTWDFFKEDHEDVEEEEKRLSTDQEGSSSGGWDNNMSTDYEDKELSLKLNLNHQEVINAWSDRPQQPLWTNTSLLRGPANALYSGEVPVMDEGRNMRREASVLRYKEKRQSRLFSKKIRYQVRKLNADKRPRFKACFVPSQLTGFPLHLQHNSFSSLNFPGKAADLTHGRSCLLAENNNNAGSDSDSNSVEEWQDYYEPISAVDLDGGDNNDEESYLPINGDKFSNGLSNGHCMIQEAVDGVSSISINGNAEAKSDTEEETETETVTPDSEIRTAFEEDERRRRSPLLVENAARVMEAMRAISFPGTAPDWASDVNEDRWVDQLRRLRSTSQ
ncbi:unnamed protein product [Brassica napus]|uniref:(rape) hypothetical protein n=1 Tax=Brassica napus TaxID=3708 RepID=A0A816TUL9_BRANA|nr:unnamed protein product [Brassica napus]